MFVQQCACPGAERLRNWPFDSFISVHRQRGEVDEVDRGHAMGAASHVMFMLDSRHVVKYAPPVRCVMVRGSGVARNMGMARRTMRISRAVRARGVGRAVRMLALASRGQLVPTAHEGFFPRGAFRNTHRWQCA